jgi:hypothetical protein
MACDPMSRWLVDREFKTRPAMKRQSSVAAPSGAPKISLAARYLQLKCLRKLVQEAERSFPRHVKLGASGSRFNLQRRHQA